MCAASVSIPPQMQHGKDLMKSRCFSSRWRGSRCLSMLYGFPGLKLFVELMPDHTGFLVGSEF